jgi:hypothetical protein
MSNIPENQGSLREKYKAATESNDSDKDHNLIKAGISVLPGVGPLVVPFFENYVVSPAKQRVDTLLEALVQELEELKFKFESVDFDRPVFQTTLMRACEIALHTHQEQKLEALRNLVLNSSIPSSVEDDILAMFLNWIDSFTALHISTLKLLHYPGSCTQKQLPTYFPRLEQNRAVYNQVLKDLEGRGLINREDIDDIFSAHSSFGRLSKTTELGEQFIEFIEYPLLPS